jgi:glycosyltransferase involved in cell wall biosynthesis
MRGAAAQSATTPDLSQLEMNTSKQSAPPDGASQRRSAGVISTITNKIRRRLHKVVQRLVPPAKQYRVQSKWPSSKPLVSVIIPCYNYGRFIAGAIESVRAQTLQRFEMIVIDDGSTDEYTQSVIRKLDYPRMRVVTQINQGLAETRNIGASLSEGKYLCYLDADDAIRPTYLEKTVRILESDESLGSCFSWVKCFGDADSIWKTEDLDPCTLRERVTASSHSVIRKDAWAAVREFNGSGFLSKYNGYFEDWVFWIDMIQCGYRGQVIREPLIQYRVHQQSLGATHKAGFRSMLEVLHNDRYSFFHDAAYCNSLTRRLRRRAYVLNPAINMQASDAVD